MTTIRQHPVPTHSLLDLGEPNPEAHHGDSSDLCGISFSIEAASGTTESDGEVGADFSAFIGVLRRVILSARY